MFFFLSPSPPKNQIILIFLHGFLDSLWSKTSQVLSSVNLFQSIRTSKGSLLSPLLSVSSKTISLSQMVVSWFYLLRRFQLTVQLFRTSKASGLVDQFTSIKLTFYQLKTAPSPITHLKTVVVRFFSIKPRFHHRNKILIYYNSRTYFSLIILHFKETVELFLWIKYQPVSLWIALSRRIKLTKEKEGLWTLSKQIYKHKNFLKISIV